jgi:hypothetical protein
MGLYFTKERFSMKKVILGAVAMMVLSGSAFGWQYFGSQYVNTGRITQQVKCENGAIGDIARANNQWVDAGAAKSFNSFDEAANNFCTRKSISTVTVSQNSVLFSNEDKITECLTSTNSIINCKFNEAFSGRGPLAEEVTGKVNRFVPKKEVVIDKNGKLIKNVSASDTKTIKKNGYKVVMLINGYYEIEDGSGNKAFVDEKDIIK